MLQAQALVGAGQHPGARMVVAHMERDADLPFRRIAAAHMHHQRLALERIGRGRGRLVGDDAAGVGLAAVAGDGGEEGVGRGLLHWRGRRGIGGRNGGRCRPIGLSGGTTRRAGRQQQEKRKDAECVHRRTVTAAHGRRQPTGLVRRRGANHRPWPPATPALRWRGRPVRARPGQRRPAAAISRWKQRLPAWRPARRACCPLSAPRSRPVSTPAWPRVWPHLRRHRRGCACGRHPS